MTIICWMKVNFIISMFFEVLWVWCHDRGQWRTNLRSLYSDTSCWLIFIVVTRHRMVTYLETTVYWIMTRRLKTTQNYNTFPMDHLLSVHFCKYLLTHNNIITVIYEMNVNTKTIIIFFWVDIVFIKYYWYYYYL